MSTVDRVRRSGDAKDLAMIHSPDLYIDSLPYCGDIKVILHQIAHFRLHGRRAQMSWKNLARSIGKSHTTLAKLIRSEKFRECIKKIRRGKKQTNLYYLQDWLMAKLRNGRIIPGEKYPQGEPRQFAVVIEPGWAARVVAGFAKPPG
jgi:hypothetical protein